MRKLICIRAIDTRVPWYSMLRILLVAVTFIFPTGLYAGLSFEAKGTLSDLYAVVSNPLSQKNFMLKSPLQVSAELLGAPGGPQEGQQDNPQENDSYQITVKGPEVSIRGNTRAAVLFGVDHFASMLEESEGLLEDGVTLERADHQVRALHLVLRNMTEARLKGYIDKARRARMNTLMLYVADDVKFERAGIRALRNSLTKAEFKSVVDYARASGMKVIPHLPLLTKQHRFFKDSMPGLMYNNSTYDPTNKKTMEKVYVHLEELIELIEPTDIHIGHDEVEGSFKRKSRQKWTASQKKKWLKEGEDMLPPALFLQHLREVSNWLGDKGIRTWIWGDMLIANAEFPGMRNKNMHGNLGYAELRPSLPKSIVICDWHYWDTGPDFPTASAFADLGHDVLGATREKPKNILGFSRFMTGLDEKGKGMIATLWSMVNRSDPEIVDKVISQSGRAFWTASDSPTN